MATENVKRKTKNLNNTALSNKGENDIIIIEITQRNENLAETLVKYFENRNLKTKNVVKKHKERTQKSRKKDFKIFNASCLTKQ